MKIRTSFVANSSSSSFLISVKNKVTPSLNIDGVTYDLDTYYAINNDEDADYELYGTIYHLYNCFNNLNQLREDIIEYLKFQFNWHLNTLKDLYCVDSIMIQNYMILIVDKIIQYANDLLKGKHIRYLPYSKYMDKYIPECRLYIFYGFVPPWSKSEDRDKVINIIEKLMAVVDKENKLISNCVVEEFYYSHNSNELKDIMMDILILTYFRVFNNFYILKTHNTFKIMHVPNGGEIDSNDIVSNFLNENDIDHIVSFGNFEIVSVGG